MKKFKGFLDWVLAISTFFIVVIVGALYEWWYDEDFFEGGYDNQ